MEKNGIDGEKGSDGLNGKSAYELALQYGFTGTEEEWLASIKGTNGSNGKSAYELALEYGFTGTEEEWLASLKGEDGKDGADGKDVQTTSSTTESDIDEAQKINVKYELNVERNSFIAIISANYEATIDMNEYEWDKSNYSFSANIDLSSVTEVRLEEGCSIIKSLKVFDNLETLIVSEAVDEIEDLALPKINSIYIIGKMPRVGSAGLYTGIKGDLWVNQSVYYEAELSNPYQFNNVKIYGKKYVQSTPNTSNEITAANYGVASAEKAIEIAEYIVDGCVNDIDNKLLLFPYSSPNDYKEIKQFTLDLIKDCKSEEEKALRIYIWVIENIKFNYNGAAYSVYKAFTERKGVCSQFATITHDMFSAAGIVSFYIHGQKGSFENYSLENLINYEVSNSAKNHAWLIAKVEGKWKFYDTSSGNMNTCGMNPSESNDLYRVAKKIENITCLPEDLDATLIDTSVIGALVFEEGKPQAYYMGAKVNSFIFTTLYNGGFTLEHQTYYDYGWTRHYIEFDETSIDNEEGDLIRSKFFYVSYGTFLESQCGIFTSASRYVGYSDGLTYLVNEYGVNKVNQMLEGSVFSIDESKLYFNDDEVATYR